MNMVPLLSVDHPFDEALRWTRERLSLAGLRAMQTFDLHAARMGVHDCPCPNHGTADCDCQMVVVLVFGQADEPATLFLHGNDGQTWLSVAETPQQRASVSLLGQIRSALEAPIPMP